MVAGVVLSAALVSVGCGSTAPSTPSPLPQYPQLVGEWVESGSFLELHYRDTNTTLTIEACAALLSVRAQADGTFSGSIGVQGGSPDSDRQCTYSFTFTAQMSPDGTLTGFSPNPTFRTQDCSAGSDATFSGTASSTAIRIVMTDRGTCRGAVGRLSDTDRTLTLSVRKR